MSNRPLPLSFWALSLTVAAVAVSMPWDGSRSFFGCRADSPQTDGGLEPESPAMVKTRLVVQRSQEKQTIARDVAAGRTTLLAAAARYRQLHAGDPLKAVQMAEAATEDELYCRNVINFVRYSGPAGAPSENAAVADRLETELAQLRARKQVLLPVAP